MKSIQRADQSKVSDQVLPMLSNLISFALLLRYDLVYAGFSVEKILKIGKATHSEKGHIGSFVLQFQPTLHKLTDVNCSEIQPKSFKDIHPAGTSCPNQWGDGTDPRESKFIIYSGGKDSAVRCRFCEKSFWSRSSVIRHEKDVCKHSGAPQHDFSLKSVIKDYVMGQWDDMNHRQENNQSWENDGSRFEERFLIQNF